MATGTSYFESDADAAEYAASRIELVRGRLRSAPLIILALTILFELVVAWLVPEQWEAEWFPSAILLVLPTIALAASYTSVAERPQLLFLFFDVVYTFTILVRFLLPSAVISSLEAFTITKLMGTAVLIPWSPAMQMLSAAITMTFYLGFFALSGNLHQSVDLPHQLASPFFGVLLSTIGVVGADRLRQRLFLQRKALQQETLTNAHFAATMSHDLRNLLGAVQGYGEMLREGGARIRPSAFSSRSGVTSLGAQPQGRWRLNRTDAECRSRRALRGYSRCRKPAASAARG